MTGKIHLYYGDGKGKTSAAVGLTVRAAGYRKNVWFVQFLKGCDTGELVMLRALPTVTVMRGNCTKFFFQMTEEEKKAVTVCHDELLLRAKKAADEQKCEVLVLDEVLGAVETGLLNEELLKDFLLNKPDSLELILTGRNPAPYMIDAADYCSEIKKQKHPFDCGIPAREGIEY